MIVVLRLFQYRYIVIFVPFILRKINILIKSRINRGKIMKRKIIFGSLLAVFLLSMLPSVPAVEFNAAVEANESRIIEHIQTISIPKLREEIKNIDVEDLFGEVKDELKENDIQPQCFTIILLIIKLFLRIIGRIIGFTFGAIGKVVGFIGRIIGFIASLIGFVVGIIGSIFGLVAGAIGAIIGLIFGILGKIIGWIIDLIIPGKHVRSA